MRRRIILFGLAMMLIATSADAREALGIYDRWGAFRDDGPRRCFAISTPVDAPANARQRAFASIATWPGQRARGQLHIRLSQPRNARTQVTLSIGERRFALVAGDSDAWASDSRTDTAIVSAIRSSRSMSVEALGQSGRPFADVYTLRGAATAIDAAALGCVGRS